MISSTTSPTTGRRTSPPPAEARAKVDQPRLGVLLRGLLKMHKFFGGDSGYCRRNLTPPNVSSPSHAMSTRHKIANLVGVPMPLIGLVVAIVLLWNRAIGPLELALMVGLYVVTALGVTLGYHRMFTHRAFQSSRTVPRDHGGDGLDGGPGPGHHLGGRPSQASRLHRPGGRSALAAPRRPRLCRGGQGPVARPHRVAVRVGRHRGTRAVRARPGQGPCRPGGRQAVLGLGGARDS